MYVSRTFHYWKLVNWIHALTERSGITAASFHWRLIQKSDKASLINQFTLSHFWGFIHWSKMNTNIKPLQESYCTYNVAYRRFCVIIFVVEKQYFLILWVCVCSLNYPACKAHASVACPALPYILRYLTNGTIFGKSLHVKYVFWFSLQISSEIFLIVRGNQWDIIINVHRSSCKVPVILVRF